MTGLVERLLHVPSGIIYAVVGLLVFAEDAIFVGFVIPGETAAVIGGVAASRDRVSLAAMIVIVVAAAIVGDSAGYEVGRIVGTRLLDNRLLEGHRGRVTSAQDLLARRGGAAVFLGRFIAFFRAMMPALAGSSRMSYGRFLTFNAAGGIVWGVTFVLVGYLAGNSYETVAKNVGRGVAAAIAAVVVVILVGWRVRRSRSDA